MFIGIGNRIGKGGGVTWTSPSQPLGGETPEFWVKENSRSGLTLTDSLGNNASILPSCALCDANNYMIRTVANFGSGVTAATGGYVTIRFYFSGNSGVMRLFNSGDEAATTRTFQTYVNNSKAVIYVTSPTGPIGNQCVTDANLSIGWHTIKFESVSSHYKMTIDGNVLTVGAGLTMALGIDDGKWIGDVSSRDNISVGCIKISSLYTSTTSFYCDYVDFNANNIWYMTGVGQYEYDSLDIMRYTWTGSSHVYYGNNISNHLMDVGYSIYTKDGVVDEYVPYVSVGVPDTSWESTLQYYGYLFWGNVAGDSQNYNITPALIEFPAFDNYDRSNTTIHKAAARAEADYDASHPTRWRGKDVCNPDVYYSWKNTGYEAKQFAKIDFILANPTKAYEFISYTTNKNSSNLAKIEGYCNIDDYYHLDIILMGDKTDGPVLDNSDICNGIYAAQNPDFILGVGDYSDDVYTTAQLMNGIENEIKFSSPGNHDDWAYGTRTNFNTYFRNGSLYTYGGGSGWLSLPNVDIFIYDEWLKMDQSDYVADQAEALAISLADRQASAQGQWLINGLATSTKTWKVVIFHEPAWASDATAAAQAAGVVTMDSMRWDWYALGADLILSGHFHLYERLLKNTGSGDVPYIICDAAGATQIDFDYDNLDPDSLYRANSFISSDFGAGMLIKMTVTRSSLQVDLSGIDTDGNLHSGKDQLILT